MASKNNRPKIRNLADEIQVEIDREIIQDMIAYTNSQAPVPKVGDIVAMRGDYYTSRLFRVTRVKKVKPATKAGHVPGPKVTKVHIEPALDATLNGADPFKFRNRQVRPHEVVILDIPTLCRKRMELDDLIRKTVKERSGEGDE
jgi:hypothetical protein